MPTHKTKLPGFFLCVPVALREGKKKNTKVQIPG